MALPLLKLVVLILFSLLPTLSSSARFHELFEPSWASDHFAYEGEFVKLKLDNQSGAGFRSRSKYMYGKFSMNIKLVAGDSAGTVTTFYMASDGPNHNEFDFEFLGNVTGEPYLVQTNVYVNGVGNREERLNLWFDPTQDFHSYSILWNQHHVVFLVDDTPVRVHRNLEVKGIPFPKDQAMVVCSSIWNADDWATQGGRVKTNWSHAPFVASYKGFHINACECPLSLSSTEHAKRCGVKKEGTLRSWNMPSRLNVHQNHQLLWVRANHMVYNYCEDVSRFPVIPLECQRGRR